MELALSLSALFLVLMAFMAAILYVFWKWDELQEKWGEVPPEEEDAKDEERDS